jgi:phosphate uptake regulator
MASPSTAAAEPVRRKVQLSGGTTFTVSLPKAWAEARGLEPGSALRLYPLEDRVVVAPDGNTVAGRSATIRADGLAPDALAGHVRAAYTVGCDDITITGPDGLASDQRRVAADTLAGLVGLEVDRGDPDGVAAHSMLDASAVSQVQTLRQLRRLALSTYREAVDAVCQDDAELAASVQRRTPDVDRFVALLARQFHGALVDVGEVERLDVGRATAFRHYRTAQQLGAIARDAAAVAAVADAQSSPPPEAVAEHLRACGGCVRDRLGEVLSDDADSTGVNRQALADATDALADAIGATTAPDAHHYGRLPARLRTTERALAAIDQARFQAQVTQDGTAEA